MTHTLPVSEMFSSGARNRLGANAARLSAVAMGTRLEAVGALGRLEAVAVRWLSIARARAKSRYVVHAAQKPPEESEIDFGALGLKYPLTHKPEYLIKRTAWTPPPPSPPTTLPFAVDRTTVGSSLPVYTDYKAGRTKVVTILRRCRGDIDELKGEMEKVVGKPVTIRPGKLVVDGNFHGR